MEMKARWLAWLAAIAVGLPSLAMASGAMSAGSAWQEEEQEESSQDSDQEEQEPTLREQMQAILAEYNQAMADFRKALSEAEPEERARLIEQGVPDAATVGRKLLDFAQANASDPVAVDALSWIMSRIREGEVADAALEILVRDHLDKPELGQMVQMLAYSRPSDKIENALEKIATNSPVTEIQANATMALASYLMRSGAGKDDAGQARIEQLFEKVISEFGDVAIRNTTLGARAEAALFELRRLQIGMEVPDIEGEDLDGEAFRLSDYRGKVVVIDFWGDW